MLLELFLLSLTLIAAFVVWYGAILLLNLLWGACYLAWKAISRFFRS